MRALKDDMIKIYQTERGLLILIILNIIVSIGLLIFSIVSLNPNSTVVKIGYGDIGGYRDGTWLDMLVFPLFAVIFGFFHSLISIRIFHKRGGGMAKFFTIVTIALTLSSALVLARLLGEG